jgi:arylsulfatase
MMNLILVSYDSVRADVAFSGKFPAIERLRAQGTTFRNCVASAPLTPVSHTSIMTGLQPFHHGVRHLFRESLRPGTPTLAVALGKAGFSTSAVVSCPGLSRWYGIDSGFGRYDDEIPRLPDGTDPLQTVDVKLRGTALKRASLVVERARGMLAREGDRPFFHFVHFFDAHWPYNPPDRPFAYAVANDYEAEIAYLDHHFNALLDWLEQSGKREDTLIVLFGDHGEDLDGLYPNDKGGEANGHPEEMGHGCLLYDQTIMVPLIFSHPSFPRRELREQVRLIDVMPTCLELLGVELRHQVDGVSLADAVMGRVGVRDLVGYSETHYPREQVEASGGSFGWTRDKKSLRFGNRYKVIIHLGSDEMEAYDLLEDPNETFNLAGPAARERKTEELPQRVRRNA